MICEVEGEGVGAVESESAGEGEGESEGVSDLRHLPAPTSGTYLNLAEAGAVLYGP